MQNNAIDKNQSSQKKKNNPNPQKKRKKNVPKEPRTQKSSEAIVAFGNSFTNSKPKLISKGTDVTVHHCEYVDVLLTQTGSFNVQKNYSINPSNPLLFPFLSSIASRFESYRFEKLIIRYRTEAATSIGGYIVFAVDFNIDDPVPSVKQQVMQYQSVLTGPYWQNMEVALRKEDLSKRKSYFCNNSTTGEPADLSLYDTGNLFVCAGNCSVAGLGAGDLFVEYVCHLMTAEFNPPVTDTKVTPTSGSLPTQPFGNAITTQYSVANQNTWLKAGPQLTALRDVNALVDVSTVGTGIGTLGSLATILGNISGAATYEPFAEIKDSTSTKTSSSGLFNMKKGDILDFSLFTLSTWATLTSATALVSPWGLNSI